MTTPKRKESRRRAPTTAESTAVVTEDASREDQEAEAYERRIRDEKAVQFQRLKDEAQAVLGMVIGRPGVQSLSQFHELLEKAGDDIGNGRFLVRYLGAERYLDPETVAVLLTLRQNLIAEIDRPKTADIMRIDAAVIGYYNVMRSQGWIGNLSLILERDLFGKRSLEDAYGPTVGTQARQQLERLSEVILPLQERAHRMMLRSLERIGN